MYIIQYQNAYDLKLFLSIEGWGVHKVMDPTYATRFESEESAINAAELAKISKGYKIYKPVKV